MTTTSATKTKSGGTRVHVQRFGTFLSGMVMPNIPAFIAWGLITAFFIPTGWTPNATLETLVGPMIVYLLPLLIANTGGRMVYGTRGAVIASIATMGVIVGSEIPMFIGAMIVGPGSAYLLKKLDSLWAGKIKPGFEMLVDNFASGILGMILALGAFFGIAPLVTGISNFLEMIVDWLVSNSLLPIASIFIEPGKILFLNNAINHGVLTPIGVQQVAENGQSVLFLLEANPGPGLGILLAFSFFGVGIARASAPGAIIIHFFGGIHEIYFPYVLMKPALLLAAVGGGMTGVAINVAFATGLRAPASPGSIIAILIQTAPGSYVGVILSVIGAATVSFLIAAVILRASRKRDLTAGDTGDMAEAIAKTEANKGKASTILGGLGASGTSATTARRVKNIIFACDAGMGSSAMGASVLRNKIKKAGLDGITVTNQAIANLDGTADLVITHQDLTARAQSKSPDSTHVSVENFMNSPKYDDVVALIQGQAAEEVAR
ncbi:PTS mannitol transporter subunit IICB [Cryobacterium sp. TMT1-19]|uniref:PTS mannitol transporter subunit IICB n=1 Tax=unclassified Cryobacterium TaxID=2649013 RepID=UPI000CE4E818|nr:MULTISPECIES: PTS mannitol transporter subunit IICB [unclassified Cryobacterium]TFB59877.1 PTS mannitol transporter subunit IICB [Cryobacterium sp. Hz7]TFD37118.1 PTS mannitol transporter subunit IICB [Cryobacterium sp. TMT1-19]